MGQCLVAWSWILKGQMIFKKWSSKWWWTNQKLWFHRDACGFRRSNGSTQMDANHSLSILKKWNFTFKRGDCGSPCAIMISASKHMPATLSTLTWTCPKKNDDQSPSASTMKHFNLRENHRIKMNHFVFFARQTHLRKENLQSFLGRIMANLDGGILWFSASWVNELVRYELVL